MLDLALVLAFDELQVEVGPQGHRDRSSLWGKAEARPFRLGGSNALGYRTPVALVETPHDSLFKDAFGTAQAARGMLERHLPAALLAKLDLSSLTPLPGSFVDEALRGSESDLLFSASLAGRPALVYVLFEHKSYPDPWVALQLAGYVVGTPSTGLSPRPRSSS